ncbi:MAG: Methyltransferase type 11 [Parcubacteria group bacterium GW2011_GWC2_39_14]|nr:MAG: Methyltransferase type 11 [Parcubacteria group bacterium GW2011_GWC2_39_14]KKR55038.1 MAG: Methyltransferase type 11 [Parcubacteria group bacterium GW2011_GWA2_40_23]
MLVKFLQQNKLFKNIIYKIGKARATDLIGRIKPLLNKSDNILDIGAGTCNVYELLLNGGYKVTALDIQNLSFVDKLTPTIYDGKKMPYDDNTFDKSIILTVLHHTSEPEKILQEAKRVSKKIVIIEDIYSNWFEKYATYFFDSLLNFEFVGHPYTNKSDEEWKEIFTKLGLKLIESKRKRSLLVFSHATYYLEK